MKIFVFPIVKSMRFFVRAFLLFACLLGTFALIVPQLGTAIKQVLLTTSFDMRGGAHFNYDRLSLTASGWKLEGVQIDTPIAKVTCAECYLGSYGLGFSLDAITADAAVLWRDQSLPPCSLKVQEGTGSLVSCETNASLLSWNHELVQLYDLPCPLALPLLTLLSPHHPLESWSAKSGTISGCFTRTLLEPFMDFTVKDLALQLEHTPLELTLEEGRWSSTPQALCAGSSTLRCTLATPYYSSSSARVLEIPKEAWHLFIQRDHAFVTLKSDLKTVWEFLGATGCEQEPVFLEMQLPLYATKSSGHLHLKDRSISLPFTIDLGTNKQLKVDIAGQDLPLAPFFAPLLPSLFPSNFSGLAAMKLEGLMHLKATLDYPQWQAKADILNAACGMDFFLAKALQGAVDVSGNLIEGGAALKAHLLRGDLLHTASGKILESISGSFCIDKDTISATDLDGYMPGIHLTGQAQYIPSQEQDQLSIHLSSASGKISAFQNLLKDIPNFNFLANLPCEGDFTLSKEGVRLSKSLNKPFYYQLYGTLVDLHVPLLEESLSAHDLSCQWSYDSAQNTFKLYNLYGSLGEDTESVFIKSDLLCSLSPHSPYLAFDFWIEDATDELLRLAGELSHIQDKLFKVECCPLRSHVGHAHPASLTMLLAQNGSLEQLDLRLPLQLEKSLMCLKRLRSLSLCARHLAPLEELNPFKQIEGASLLVCQYEKTQGLYHKLTSDSLLANGHTFKDCVLEGNLSERKYVLETLQLGCFQMAASFLKNPSGWQIPYLALQYENSLLAGFEGHFNTSTNILEGKIPLFTCRLSSNPFSRTPLQWTAGGNLKLNVPKDLSALFEVSRRISVRREVPDGASGDEGIAEASAKEPDAPDGRLAADRKLRETPNKADLSASIHLVLKGDLESHLQEPLGLNLDLQGTQKALHVAIEPQGKDHIWPIRPLSILLEQAQAGYVLKGELKDTLYPLWCEGSFSRTFSPSPVWRLYDHSACGQESLTVYFPAHLSKLTTLSLPLQIQGGLWGYSCDMTYMLSKNLISGSLSGKTSNRLPPIAYFKSPLEWLPFFATWHFQGRGRLGTSLTGDLSVMPGFFQSVPTPKWHAKVQWQPSQLNLKDVTVEDPHLACSIKSLTFTQENFCLTSCSAQEQPLSASKNRLKMPWHPHLSIPSLEISSLAGSFKSPYALTGEGRLSFCRPPIQKRLNVEDPLQKLIPLPDLFTPRQGILYFGVNQGQWQLRELKNAYSEGRLLEFLLVPGRPAFISEAGLLDMTLEARPAKHKKFANKRHIFHLQGPLSGPLTAKEEKSVEKSRSR